MAIGVSFVPSTPNQTGTSGSNAAVTPLQQAIQFLSLRLPKILGQGAIAPAATMTAAGGAGLPADAGGVEAFLRNLIQQAGQSGRPGSTAPTMAAALPSNYAPTTPAVPGATPTAPTPAIPPPEPPPSIPAPRIIPGGKTPEVSASPYQQVAPMMSAVLSRQPGSADALMQMIRQASLPSGAAPAPQPTAPQPIPTGPAASVPSQFPFNVSEMFGRSRGF